MPETRVQIDRGLRLPAMPEVLRLGRESNGAQLPLRSIERAAGDRVCKMLTFVEQGPDEPVRHDANRDRQPEDETTMPEFDFAPLDRIIDRHSDRSEDMRIDPETTIASQSETEVDDALLPRRGRLERVGAQA
jgi:hypothetical protein